MDFEFESEVFRWAANPAFFMLSLPIEESTEISEMAEGLTNGFGSLKVEARIGATVWRTSIFPDAKSGCFHLPLKASVRKAKGLVEGSQTTVQLTVLGF